ncbi:ABC transporter ATP-binding protein [Oscillibacter valericigenes]|uniref:ABC transporter ATP-binding protein n=1 Tax=Oscillibacter valericigenes TaxID=351091 RepID=UPI001F1E7B5D|nr:ABC transporter ATP-binding protein [Oscillibacter valericigenes]MCF2664530.1 ABC transporter ATP-binding protein [Oscillibacter valericigenes]
MIKKLWPHARPYEAWIAAGIACSAGEAIFELLIPLVMSDIVNIGIPAADQSYILWHGLKMVLMALVSLALGAGAAVCSSVAGQGFGANLRRAEYEHIQEYAFSNIEKFSTASLVTRLTSDANNMQMSLMMSMRLLVRAPVMLVAALVLSIRISLRLSSVFLVALPLLAVVVATILIRTGPVFRSLQERTDALNLVVQENLAGIRVVKSFVRADYEQEKFTKRNRNLKETSEKAFGMVVINMPIMMLIVNATLIAVIWFGGGLVNRGELLTGDLMAYFTYIMQIMMSLMMVSMVFMMLTRSVACARRIVEVLEERPAMTDEAAKEDAVVRDGSIDFDHVYFKYHENSPEWVLRDVDLHIKSGQTVGILGGTGSAKTTLVSLIPRLYEAQEGTVRVGGRPVKDYTMVHLRDAVSMVLQKNTLFSGTIRENLLWGAPDATEEQLWAACRAACADEFLERMPDGLDTDLGQGGVNVSGGQKQRLCIARAILKQPKVLILDDSTSAVDTATDAKIRTAFANELKDTTKIIIAQRVTSVMEADQILVMDDGRLVAHGTHEELMKTCDIYRDVYQAQQEGVSIGG